MVENVNKSNPNIDKRIFSGLGENFDFDTSMRQFTSTANTRIVNDQGAFAQFYTETCHHVKMVML